MHAAISAELSCSPGPPPHQGEMRDPVCATVPIHVAPTPSKQGAWAETEPTHLQALHVALHSVPLHQDCSEADALALTLSKGARYLCPSLSTDLVSVGSYRTNISMSDFESVKEYSASNNACVKDTQETQIGGDGTC